MEVLLGLRRKAELPELSGRPAAILTQDEIARSYGAAEQDIENVVQVLEELGLQKISGDIANASLTFSGTVAAMEAAFQVELFDYAHADGDYRGYTGSKHIPAELADIVTNVAGLDNRQVARRRRHRVHDNGQTAAAGLAPTWYTSAELAEHYNFPSGDGGGEAVGIVEFGGGYFPDDLRTFCALAKVPMPAVKTVSVDGTSTAAKDGAESEVMLDVEVIAGVCPKATIVVYFAEWSEKGWLTVLNAVLNDQENNPGVISISWGAPEDTDIWTDATMAQVNDLLKQAAYRGITVCVAAGDDGSSDADGDGRAHVDFPACSEYVLSVGGTTIPEKGTTQPDVVWFEGNGLRQDHGGSSGGGVSTIRARPSWQDKIAVDSVNAVSPGATAFVGRCIPDLSANADWNASPYLLVVDGANMPNGGTSAAAPLVASLLILINAERSRGGMQRLGFVTPVLYQPVAGVDGSTVGAMCCTDVVVGNNATAIAGGYTAGSGYDAVSGWGTPNGRKLLEAFSAI
jgi:kumamolisin